MRIAPFLLERIQHVKEHIMIRLVSLVIGLMLTACTSQMWQAPTYQEKILGYYGAKEEKLLIVEGEEYSYIFEATQQLIDVLVASRTQPFDPYYSDFKVDENNNVRGNFELIARGNPDKEQLRKMGFFENKFKNMVMRVPLTGKIYKLEGEIPLEKLKTDHFVLVQTPETGLSTLGKVVATPATLTIDAGMVIAAGSIFALVGTMSAIDR